MYIYIYIYIYVYIYMCCRGAETKKHMLMLILNEIGNIHYMHDYSLLVIYLLIIYVGSENEVHIYWF